MYKDILYNRLNKDVLSGEGKKNVPEEYIVLGWYSLEKLQVQRYYTHIRRV